jgi:hypothetical protein
MKFFLNQFYELKLGSAFKIDLAYIQGRRLNLVQDNMILNQRSEQAMDSRYTGKLIRISQKMRKSLARKHITQNPSNLHRQSGFNNL